MRYLFLCILTCIIPQLMIAQIEQNIAAAHGLEKYKKLILLQPRKENQLTASDTASLILGQALPTAIVPLDKLKGYKAGQPAETVISDINEVIYPVIYGKDQTISGSVTLDRKGDQWTATRFGSDQKSLQDVAEYLVDKRHSYRLVKILAFHLSFLSYSDSGVEMFIPMQEDSGRAIFKGKAVPATSVLEKYVKAAQDYNGLPM
jgi:hypothetical protein